MNCSREEAKEIREQAWRRFVQAIIEDRLEDAHGRGFLRVPEHRKQDLLQFLRETVTGLRFEVVEVNREANQVVTVTSKYKLAAV